MTIKMDGPFGSVEITHFPNTEPMWITATPPIEHSAGPVQFDPCNKVHLLMERGALINRISQLEDAVRWACRMTNEPATPYFIDQKSRVAFECELYRRAGFKEEGKP